MSDKLALQDVSFFPLNKSMDLAGSQIELTTTTQESKPSSTAAAAQPERERPERLERLERAVFPERATSPLPEGQAISPRRNTTIITAPQRGSVWESPARRLTSMGGDLTRSFSIEQGDHGATEQMLTKFKRLDQVSHVRRRVVRFMSAVLVVCTVIITWPSHLGHRDDCRTQGAFYVRGQTPPPGLWPHLVSKGRQA